MIIYKDIVQQTEEWFEIKKLKMSASHGQEIGNAGKGLDTYIEALVRNACARDEELNLQDFKRGVKLEPYARKAYEFERGVNVYEVGFIEHSKYIGCSPDGLVDNDPEGEGGIEAKARNNKIHFNLLRTEKVDSKVIWQMNMCMYISGRKWWDFISYNPNFKRDLYVKRFYPDPIKFAKLEQGLAKGEVLIQNMLLEETVKKELSFEK